MGLETAAMAIPAFFSAVKTISARKNPTQAIQNTGQSTTTPTSPEDKNTAAKLALNAAGYAQDNTMTLGDTSSPYVTKKRLLGG